ncbi:uncharacterized protein [Porites lutea]|uniref:uncharacterized protein n=1 Tax=Porites lutea TaxID=51062 RepID=UPI003CC56849
MISLFGHLFWTVCLSSILSLLCLFGNRVNEKAHSFYETLQMRYVPAQDIKEHSELMLFLAHVQGEPIGLSAGVLSVINKSFFLTLVGIIASYFAVLLTLPY